MATSPARPDNLPDFKNPPLEEVSIGIQFGIPGGFSIVQAGEVWELFRPDFPTVQEHPPLAPTFETFGPSGAPPQMAPFFFPSPSASPRLWFINGDGIELLQFQKDRFHHNWRRANNPAVEYPRYETLRAEFAEELAKLGSYFQSRTGQELGITQCEIAYINNCVPANQNAPLAPLDWLKTVPAVAGDAEDFTFSFRERMLDADGKPFARFYCEIGSGFQQDGKRAIFINLTVRGAPRSSSVGDALEFLDTGRSKIVARFADITSEKAHAAWGRIR